MIVGAGKSEICRAGSRLETWGRVDVAASRLEEEFLLQATSAFSFKAFTPTYEG